MNEWMDELCTAGMRQAAAAAADSGRVDDEWQRVECNWRNEVGRYITVELS